MLRSAKAIKISSGVIQNYDGFALAPVININGLILRSDHPIPEAYKSFLVSIGAAVTRVRMNGEMFVRVTGQFNTTQRAIAEFLETVPDIVSDQAANLETVPVALRFRDILLDAAQTKYSGRPVLYDPDTRSRLTHGTVIFDGGAGIDGLVTFEGRESGDGHCTADNMMITSGGVVKFTRAQHIMFTGKKFEQLAKDSYATPGWMSFIRAGIEVLFGVTEKLQLRDIDISSAGEIIIDSKGTATTELSIDTSVDWVNNPYEKFFTPMLNQTRSGVTLTYETKEEPRAEIGAHHVPAANLSYEEERRKYPAAFELD